MLKQSLFLAAIAIAVILPPDTVAQTNSYGASLTSTYKKIEANTVTGTVLDEDGEPLPGVSVKVEDSNEATTTDVDGLFSIMTHRKKPVLIFSYVGMETERMPLSQKQIHIRVTLKQAANIMNEVVVTGYQNIKRESATGSYQVLTTKDLDNRSTTGLASRTCSRPEKQRIRRRRIHNPRCRHLPGQIKPSDRCRRTAHRRRHLDRQSL